jgi:tetratricopeptide (TPR) repeat protein
MTPPETDDIMRRALQSCVAGDFVAGERLLRQLLLAAPGSADAWFNLGKVLKDLGRLRESADAYRTAVALQPDDAEVLYNLGNVLSELRQPAEAMEVYRRGLMMNPHHPGMQTNLGQALELLGHNQEAVSCYRRAAEESPAFVPAQTHLGHALLKFECLEEAELAYRRAIASDPGAPEAYYNLAGALLAEDRYAEADEAFDRALQLRPEFPEAWVNRAIGYLLTERLDDARTACKGAIRLQPGLAEAHLNLAVALLQSGAYAEGWNEYEWRFWTADGRNPKRYRQIPEWDGQSIAGKTLLVYQEQGIGDILQCARFFPLLSRQGVQVKVACQPVLFPLFRNSRDVLELHDTNEGDVDADYACPVFSLPRIFGITPAAVPAHVPYLSVNRECVDRWRASVPARPEVLRVGLAWSGNPSHTNNRRRSLPGSAVDTLTATEGIEFHSLHARLERGVGTACIRVHEGKLNDMAEVAGLMQALDLVITVDTSFAHLAGGLGVPVWLLLNFGGDWRWMLSRSDSPWYPTMRIFRQRRPGDWSCAITDVQQALTRMREGA